MRKTIFKTIIAGTLALSCGLTAFGCGGNKGKGEQVDKEKTQLYIGLYNGGWGRDWLDEAKAQFEAKYPEYQIMITPKKEEYKYESLKNTIAMDPNDMFITACSYKAYIRDKQIMDITDAVTGDMGDVGESGKTVEGKLLDEQKDFYKHDDGKYYAVPFGSSIWGLNYDVDLFEEEGLYISATDGTGVGIKWTNGLAGSPEKHVGRDGVKGTYDDGTPVTFADFKALIGRMKQKNISPFYWSEVTGYVNSIMCSLWADAEGKDSFNIMKNLSGTFTGYNGEEVTINQQTGYNIGLMKGKKYALELVDEITKKGNYRSDAGTLGFMQAQNSYVLSKKAGKRDAFFLDGGHWYNETKAYIEETNTTEYPEYKESGRRFSVMPFPQFDNRQGTKATYLESSDKFAMFVNAQAKNADVAKKFIKFLCTDNMLKETTIRSGLRRACKYSLTDEEIAKMPYYYGEVYKLMNSENVDIVNLRMNHPFYVENTSMQEMNWLWEGSYVNSAGKKSSINLPINDLKDQRDKGLTVEKYLEGTLDTYKSDFNK